MTSAPMIEKGMMHIVHTLHPQVLSTQPRPNPVKPDATYCTPSSIPVAVAAAFFPPKSAEAVPESMPCTPKIQMQEKPIRPEASIALCVKPSASTESACPT